MNKIYTTVILERNAIAFEQSINAFWEKTNGHIGEIISINQSFCGNFNSGSCLFTITYKADEYIPA